MGSSQEKSSKRSTEETNERRGPEESGNRVSEEVIVCSCPYRFALLVDSVYLNLLTHFRLDLTFSTTTIKR